jgi:hypothetical protein
MHGPKQTWGSARIAEFLDGSAFSLSLAVVDSVRALGSGSAVAARSQVERDSSQPPSSQLPSWRAAYASFDDRGPHDAGRFGLQEFCRRAPARQIVQVLLGGLIGERARSWQGSRASNLDARAQHLPWSTLRTPQRYSGSTSCTVELVCDPPMTVARNNAWRLDLHGFGHRACSRQSALSMRSGPVGEACRAWRTALPNQRIEPTAASGLAVPVRLACAHSCG